jgi:hypothetical protein
MEIPTSSSLENDKVNDSFFKAFEGLFDAVVVWLQERMLCTHAGHYANRYSIINIIIFLKKMSIISLINVAKVYLKKEKGF